MSQNIEVKKGYKKLKKLANHLYNTVDESNGYSYTINVIDCDKFERTIKLKISRKHYILMRVEPFQTSHMFRVSYVKRGIIETTFITTETMDILTTLFSESIIKITH